MKAKKTLKNLSAKQKTEKKTEKKTEQKAEQKAPQRSVVKTAPKKVSDKKPSNGNGVTGIRKQYLKTGELCNVTFKLPKEAAPDAHVITVVGDFNNWNVSETPMKKMRTGEFKVTLKLPRGKEYRFRYFIDASRWENDWCADGYVPNGFGGDDSLVKV